jgi:hypothetical protein
METDFRQDRTYLVRHAQRAPGRPQLQPSAAGRAEHPLGDHHARVVWQQADVHSFAATLPFIENVDFAIERRVPPVVHARAKRDMGRMS